MHIVITHTDFRLYWPARIAALNDLLRSHGHTLQVIEIAGKGSPYSFAAKNSNISSLDWTCLFPERKMESLTGREAAKALWDQLERIKPDVVIAGAIAFPSGATAVRWCKSRYKPVVIFDNARLQDVPRSWLVNFIKKCIYRNVNAVISPAPSQAGAFEYWGVERERIFFGLNVVDNAWFSSRVDTFRSNKNLLLEELGLPEQFILGVGRLIEKKNWLQLVEAFAEVNQGILEKKWALVLVGEGPDKSKIKTFCKSRPLADVIMRPFASQEELCKYYALASAVVLPSSFETWGLVVNEAMAAVLPVLVSDQCGCADSLVEHGKNGYLFSPNNKSALIEVLQRFMNKDSDERIAMGKRSIEIISEWSLDRFSQAAWQAIEHAQKNPVRKKSFIDSLIIANWKGRYRPI